jgi:zinc protease
MNAFRTLLLAALIVAIPAGMNAAGLESFSVNGLKVILKANTATDIISVNLYFRGGATILSPEEAGIENLALTVATRATKKYPKDVLSATLESMNTQITSNAGVDYSSINLLCVRQFFTASWDVFADVVTAPLFAPEDVSLEQEKLIASIRQARDDPDAYLARLAEEAFYVDHPYEVDVTGTEATVASFTPEHLQHYYQGRLTTSQLLLVVVGNTTRKELEPLLQKSFGTLKVGTYAPPTLPSVNHHVPSLKVVSRDLPTKYIRGNFPAPAFGTDDSYPMMLAGLILRDRLFEEVRTKRSLSYAPSAAVGSSFSNYGFIYVTAVEPDTTIKVMHQETERMRTEAVGDKELQDFINRYITIYYLRNESTQSQAALIARYELSGAGYAESEKFLEHLAKVTPEQMRVLCEKYIQNIQFVLLGNPAELHVKNFMF